MKSDHSDSSYNSQVISYMGIMGKPSKVISHYICLYLVYIPATPKSTHIVLMFHIYVKKYMFFRGIPMVNW